jgi:hypothetical protein
MSIEKLKEKLKTEVEQADWDMLRVHHDNGAVFIVSGHLTLMDAAGAIALDKSSFVKVWLDNGELARPSDEQVLQFEVEKFKKICDFIIIQPYVLVKLFD